MAMRFDDLLGGKGLGDDRLQCALGEAIHDESFAGVEFCGFFKGNRAMNKLRRMPADGGATRTESRCACTPARLAS